MAFHLVLLARLASRYNAYYESRPVLTMMVSNSILHGIADTVAQTITAVRARSRRSSLDDSDKKLQEDGSIPLRSPLQSANPGHPGVFEKDLLDAAADAQTATFDLERLARFAGYGFVVAPLQYTWLCFLGRVFPMVKDKPALAQATKRVLLDQIVYAPFGLCLFITIMTVAEGGGKRAITTKMRDMYVPTLKANYVLWPAVQMINFSMTPVKLQLPVASSVGIAWTAYLSLTNSVENAETRLAPPRMRQA